MSDLAVRADSKFRKLEDTFGGVAGYTPMPPLIATAALKKGEVDQLRKAAAGA